MPATVSRRTLVAGGGLLATGLFTASCAGTRPRFSPMVTAAALTGPQLRGDLQRVALAASLENLAVGLYGESQRVLASGKLGSNPAVTTFAQAVQEQHSDHAGAWNALLATASKPKVTGPDPILKPQIDKAFAQVGDLSSLIELMLVVERTMAATDLQALGTMQTPDAIAAAAVIYPVEMQHAAMLRFLLGQYPVPDAFAQSDLARPATDYQG